MLERSRPVEIATIPLPDGRLMVQRLPGALPFALIDAYARRMRYRGGEFDTLFALLTAMDDEYLAVAAERRAEG